MISLRLLTINVLTDCQVKLVSAPTVFLSRMVFTMPLPRSLQRLFVPSRLARAQARASPTDLSSTLLRKSFNKA